MIFRKWKVVLLISVIFFFLGSCNQNPKDKSEEETNQVLDLSKDLKGAKKFLPEGVVVLAVLDPFAAYKELLGPYMKSLKAPDKAKLFKETAEFLQSRLGYNPLLARSVILFVTEDENYGVLLVGNFKLKETSASKYKDIKGQKVLKHKKPKFYSLALENFGVAVFEKKRHVKSYIKSTITNKMPEDRKELSILIESISENKDAFIGAAINVKPFEKAWTRNFKAPPPDSVFLSMKRTTVNLVIKGEPESLNALVKIVEEGKIKLREILKDGMANLDEIPLIPGLGLVIANSISEPVMSGFSPKVEGGKIHMSISVQESGLLAAAGVFSAVAVPAFMKYSKRSKTTEAHLNLNKICEGANAFMQKDQYYPKDHVKEGFPVPLEEKTFPLAQKPVFSHKKVPSGTSELADADFNLMVWQDLSFMIAEPTYYQYEYKSEGSGSKATYTVTARGDMDGDGIFSEFVRSGNVTNDGEPYSGGVIVTRELE